jgi:N-acetylmuramoyl-L-alanine amidase
MNKIYLSASQQPNNKYTTTPFSEEDVMHLYVKILKKLLEFEGFEIKVSDPTKTMMDNIAEANAWEADMYISHHTNAFNGKNDGTLGLYYPSEKSKQLTKCIYDEVAKVTPSTDEGMREGKGLAELRKTNMPATLIELFYHDNINDMKNGILKLNELAEAETQGILKYVQMKRNSIL